jgi:Icc-related predicted phosphoesterase
MTDAPTPSPLRLIHVSDTHGPIPFERIAELFGDTFDALVHTGDWVPDPPARSFGEAVRYQMEWLEHEGAALAAFLDGRPFFGCLGNHDPFSEAWVERQLRSLGVNAHYPGDFRIRLPGLPWVSALREVPWIGLGGHGQLGAPELAEITRQRAEVWEEGDIFLAHCPPVGRLSGPPEEACGNEALTTWLGRPKAPRLVLCGHIHETPGVEVFERTTVVNSARSVSLVTLPPAPAHHVASATFPLKRSALSARKAP